MIIMVIFLLLMFLCGVYALFTPSGIVGVILWLILFGLETYCFAREFAKEIEK